jgi:hypothetical protein
MATQSATPEPLTLHQKMFNQRLLAEHCWTEEVALHVYYNEILQQEPPMVILQQQHSVSSNSKSNRNTNQKALVAELMDTIKCCNAQLQYFGLEIVSIGIPISDPSSIVATMKNRSSRNKDADTAAEEDDVARPTPTKIQKYYTMMNQYPDNIAKDVFQNTLFQPPVLQAYVKLVLHHLLQRPPPKTATRATLLNLKNDIPYDNVTTKLTLSMVEDMMERLIEEHWLIEVRGNSPHPTPDNDVDDDDDDEDDNLHHNKKRRSNIPSTKNSTRITIGPRSYCELSYLFMNHPDESDVAVVDTTQIPQPIYIRF